MSDDAAATDPFYARVRAFADEQGRLPVPDQAGWEVFPFDGEHLVVKPLDPFTPVEPPRNGEGGRACWRCERPDERVMWSNERWVLAGMESTGLPFEAMLMPREHLDFPDLDDEMAAELGVLSVRIARAAEALPGVARVHVNKFGDGGAHLHLFLVGRPVGMPQLWGSCLLLWEEMLPRVPAEESAAAVRAVAEALAVHGGRLH